jgi:ribonuclease P protein component
VRRDGKRPRLPADAERLNDFDVRALVSSRSYPRIGVIVPRYKHTAVDRNRLKRRLRELVRTRLLGELPAIDLVIRALPTAYAARFDALAAQVESVRRVYTRE